MTTPTQPPSPTIEDILTALRKGYPAKGTLSKDEKISLFKEVVQTIHEHQPQLTYEEAVNLAFSVWGIAYKLVDPHVLEQILTCVGTTSYRLSEANLPLSDEIIVHLTMIRLQQFVMHGRRLLDNHER